MNRVSIVAELVLLTIGLLWPWLSKLPFGRLPGDIASATDFLSISRF
jgi:hypothetical protein